MKLTQRSLACDRLIDALTNELLLADDEDIDPRQTGRTLRSAADQVRRHVAEVLRRVAAESVPSQIPVIGKTWPRAVGHRRRARDEPR